VAETPNRDREDKGREDASHAVRLSPREWAVAIALLAPVLLLTSSLWARWERFEPQPHYRVPHAQSSDYWHIERWVSVAARDGKTIVLGDSVIWGRYVAETETLTAHLTASGGAFANAGINGLHPAAVNGLIRHFGAPLDGAAVVVHLNPLWFTSPRRDLTMTKAADFNHPDLVPQFVPSVPCYKAPWSERVDSVVLQTAPFAAWASHLRHAYLGGADLPTWTVEHPYSSPFSANSAPEAPAREWDSRPWTERDFARQTFSWVRLGSSLQWRLFREALAALERRGARVFVLVGPFNEHLIAPDALPPYRALLRSVADWLTAEGHAFAAPDPLPSNQYADASHPTASGYAMLASALLRDAAFQRFAQRPPAARPRKQE